MRNISCLLGLAVLAVLGGCASAPPYDPFRVTEEQFHAKVKRIALAPVAISAQSGVSAETRQRFDAQLETRIQALGFATVPARIWREAMERGERESGGLFDPKTGRLDSAKADALIQRTMREVQAQAQFDAVLFPTLQPVTARFAAGIARWDGASEELFGKLFGVLPMGGNVSGTVGALTLVIEVKDAAGSLLYLQHGGVQVLQKISGSTFTPVPKDEILTKDERNLRAIEIASEALSKKPAAK